MIRLLVLLVAAILKMRLESHVSAKGGKRFQIGKCLLMGTFCPVASIGLAIFHSKAELLENTCPFIHDPSLKTIKFPNPCWYPNSDTRRTTILWSVPRQLSVPRQKPSNPKLDAKGRSRPQLYIKNVYGLFLWGSRFPSRWCLAMCA